MSRYVEGENRKQLSMLPISLDDMISNDNPVRIIDALVDSLDMKSLGFQYAVTKDAGRKPYNPRTLLKLYIYGYYNGIRSTRKLERECRRNMEVMWLIDSLRPDDKTISNFRQYNSQPLIKVFKEFSLMCNELKLYGKEVVAIDGSPFRASNSRKKCYTKNKIKKMLAHYEEKASKYLELLNQIDSQENTKEIELTLEEVEDHIKAAKSRIEELKELEEEVKKNGSITITDPDSRHMMTSNNGTEISHNVQISVDSKHHLIAAVDVVSSPADQTQLFNMASQTVKNLNIKTENKEESAETDEKDKYDLTILADAGYYNGEELDKCIKNRIKPVVARQKLSNKTGDEAFSKDKFIYDKEKDIYICPAGALLYNRSRKDSKVHVYKNYEACSLCEYRDRCTKSKKGRYIKRGLYQKVYDMADKFKEQNEELYKQRQMMVEHPFGTVKRNLGYTYFLMRRNENVKAESHMHFLIYNIQRVINIRGFNKLLEDLRAKREALYAFLCSFFKTKIVVENLS